MNMMVHGTGSSGTQNVGRTFTPGKSYKAGTVLLDPATGLWFEQKEDGAFGYPSHDIIDQTDYKLISELTPLELKLSAETATDLSLYIVTSDTLAFEIDWKDGNGFVSATSATTEAVTYGSPFTGDVIVRFAAGQFPIELRCLNSEWRITQSNIKAFLKYNTLHYLRLESLSTEAIVFNDILVEGTNVDYISYINPVTVVPNTDWGEFIGRLNWDYLYLFVNNGSTGTLDFDKITYASKATYALIYLFDCVFHGDIAAFFTRFNHVDTIRFTGSASSTTTSGSIPDFIPRINLIYLNLYLTTEQVDGILEGIANRANPLWYSNKRLEFGPRASAPSAAGLIHKTTIEGQSGSPTVIVQ